jgi:hypothetical protein
MSTLKTTNLQHPSAASPAIVLDADGDATYSGVHDFSAATVTGAPQGLVHINTTTFSAVSSVSLNDVFTSDYENYLMLIKWTASAISDITVRMRVSGSDNSASSYVRQRLLAYATSVSAARTTGTSSTLSNAGTALNSLRADIFNPFTSEVTGIVAAGKSSESTASMNHSVTTHDVASSFDGITVFPLSGTITGTIRIYGYSNGA